MEIVLKRISISILLACCFLLLSCLPKRIPLEERTPAGVLDKLIQHEQRLHSLAVLLSLKATNQQGKISSNVELYWSEPDSFAFYFQSPLGFNAVRGRLIQDSLELYFVGDNKYFKGNYTNLGSERFLVKDIKEILSLVKGEYRLEKESLTKSYYQGGEIVYEFEDQDWTWKWWVDPGKARIRNGIFFSRGSKDSFKLNFKSYFETKGVEFPRLIEIRSFPREELVKLKFIERKANYAIPSNRFELKIPPSAIRMNDLEQL